MSLNIDVISVNHFEFIVEEGICSKFEPILGVENANNDVFQLFFDLEFSI